MNSLLNNITWATISCMDRYGGIILKTTTFLHRKAKSDDIEKKFRPRSTVIYR